MESNEIEEHLESIRAIRELIRTLEAEQAEHYAAIDVLRMEARQALLENI